MVRVWVGKINATRMPQIAAPANTPIPKYKFSEPRHNFPGRKGVASAEDRFTIAFARAYAAIFQKVHAGTVHTDMAMAREIPVNGYGIADLLAVAWQDFGNTFANVEDFLQRGEPRTRAFECKLSDWRKAMSQAARYRFFAQQAVAVLPESVCHRALPYLETFQKIRVGLWGFDEKSGRITAHHTPRPMKPKSERCYLHSVRIVDEATSRALPIF